jgi:VWFA-related protein
VALLFDDTHPAESDLQIARTAASAFLDSLSLGDRVGMYSISGQFTHEFSGNKEELKKALAGLKPHLRLASSGHDCPEVSYYMANQVDTLQDAGAMEMIVNDALHCAYGGDPRLMQRAERLARTAVLQAISLGSADSTFFYDRMEAMLRRLAAMPGKKTLLFVSPGLSVPADKARLWRIVDEANRAKIVINTIDERGLFTSKLFDGSSRGVSSPQAMQYASNEQQDQAVLLGELADGTGGTLFHNSNDIVGGMQQLGSAPAITYVLMFAPQKEKKDGGFHKLKVQLAEKGRYQIQARNGYYAEAKTLDARELAEAEMQDALVAPGEIRQMHMELQTKFVKNSAAEAELTVITRVEIKDVPFQKVEERHCNAITVVTAIFDENGNNVQREEKGLDLKLTNATYEKFLSTEMLMKGTYSLKPGIYVVRQLVREGGEGRMSVESAAVNIPN